jgi:hypothetical protein
MIIKKLFDFTKYVKNIKINKCQFKFIIMFHFALTKVTETFPDSFSI